MFRTAMTPPSFNQADIDAGMAKGRAARSKAVLGLMNGLFRTHEPRFDGQTA